MRDTRHVFYRDGARLKTSQYELEQDLNLRFGLGYKDDFNLTFVALGSIDFTSDDVGGFVGEFSTFDKFKRAFVAFNFCDPTDIAPPSVWRAMFPVTSSVNSITVFLNSLTSPAERLPNTPTMYLLRYDRVL